MLHYIPADSYKTAYIIEQTRTCLPGSRLHAAASPLHCAPPNASYIRWRTKILGFNDVGV